MPQDDQQTQTEAVSEGSALDAALDSAGVHDIEEPTKSAEETKTPEVKTEETKSEDVQADDGKVAQQAQDDAGEAAKAPAAPGEGATAQAPTQQIQQEPADREIDAIQQPKGLNPTNQENWKKLRLTAKTYKAKLFDALEYMEKIKADQGKIPEEVTKELEDLRSMRRALDIGNDPEFKQKYDAVIDSNFSAIEKLLLDGGMDAKQMDEIKAKGGLAKYSLDWWYQEKGPLTLLEKSENPEERALGKIIEKKLTDTIILQREKQAAIAEASKNGSEYLKTREAATVKQREDEKKRMQSHVEKIRSNVPWASPVKITDAMTPEQRKTAEAHNAAYAQLEKVFDNALNPKTPEERVEAAACAALAYKLQAENDVLISEIKRLQGEVGRLKKADTQPRSGAPQAPKIPNTHELLKMRDADAIEQGMKQVGL